MNLSIFVNRVLSTVKSNSPELLTGLGVSGVITTSYLVGRASFTAAQIIKEDEDSGGVSDDPKQRLKERFHHTWRLYIPAGVSGVLTIACIVGASRTSGKRTAAAVAAYSVGERAFSDYREKVIEQIGAKKEQGIRDSVAQDKVSLNPVSSSQVLVIGGGEVLCCELHTNRYFHSNMERLRKAVNDINLKIVNQLNVDLDEFYDLIDLPHTSHSGNMGWDSSKLLELYFSSVLAEGGEPCLAFEYNYLKPLR